MRSAPGVYAILSLAAVLIVAGCGGGGAGSPSPSSRPAGEQPVGWKRCSSASHGFSIAYPGSWHVASYQRLRVLGKGEAHRRQFFQDMVCLHYDPKPFTVYEATEGPQTAVTVSRLENARAFRQSRSWFQQPYVRTILHQAVVVAGRPAIRFHVYLRPGAVLWDRSHIYGYMINFGRKGGIVIEAWRYGSTPIPWKQYRSNMTQVDRMAPTARLTATS